MQLKRNITFFLSIFLFIIYMDQAKCDVFFPFSPPVEWELNGELKFQGQYTQYNENTNYGHDGPKIYEDYHFASRHRLKVYWENWGYFETHYDLRFLYGHTQKKDGSQNIYANEQTRLLDLTSIISQQKNPILLHRLDRLAAFVQPEWGTIGCGRQVTTWGHGLIFNPMDIFNPFSPTDQIRDYKIGDDMLTLQTLLFDTLDLSILYIPRRNLSSKKIEWQSSSLATKAQFVIDTLELEIMGAYHYDSYVSSLGLSGSLFQAAWRSDVVWFYPKNQGDKSYFASVLNLDYSWNIGAYNCYGLVELYYNGIGKSNYQLAYLDPFIQSRRYRGELFVLGKYYLGTQIQFEAHPLLNLYLSAIMNIDDPSGIIQPKIVYDTATFFQIILNATLPYGKKGTEYGGFYSFDSDNNDPFNQVKSEFIKQPINISINFNFYY